MQLAAAIIWLAPYLSAGTADHYAGLILSSSKRYHVDPLVVAAVIHVESRWLTDKRSPTNDYGLMQVHVAKRGSERFLGRELDLLDPPVGIREGVRLLRMWKSYHERTCPTGHPHWAHMKWGLKVKDNRYSDAVGKVLSSLRRRIHRPRNEVATAGGRPGV